MTATERDPVTWGAESVLGLVVLYGGGACWSVAFRTGTTLGLPDPVVAASSLVAAVVPFAALALAYGVDFQVPELVRRLGRFAGGAFLLYLAYVVAGMVAFSAAVVGLLPPDAGESLPDAVLVVVSLLPAVGLFAVLVGWYARNG